MLGGRGGGINCVGAWVYFGGDQNSVIQTTAAWSCEQSVLWAVTGMGVGWVLTVFGACMYFGGDQNFVNLRN